MDCAACAEIAPFMADPAPHPPQSDTALELQAKVCKVDSRLGIVFGYAIVCKVGDKPFRDVQGDIISESGMLDATTRFMEGSRIAKVMHQGSSVGKVVHSFPLTVEIAKALGIEAERYGWIVGMKPDEATLSKFASGELTGFSIGGRRKRETVIDE